jgi:rRNA small subunit pseudouridine methyltransferase Nep1
MKRPAEVLLDRAFHHAAMQELARKNYRLPVERMGRPDIVHNTLLQVLETPLNWGNRLRVFVHTQEDYVISIDSQIRLPKNYVRFVGLMEQLFSIGRVPERGDPLMQIRKSSVQELAASIPASDVLGFSTLGRPKLMREVADYVGTLAEPLVCVGGFPRGHFSKETMRVVRATFKIDMKSIDAWVVAGRFVYDFEWVIGVAQKRVKPKND